MRVGRTVIGMTTTVDELADSRYVLLVTYRKDGTAVPTPVWVVRHGAALAVWSGVDTGKVKRIRRNPAVTLATCDFRGNHAGPAHSGQAVILDAAGSAEVRRQIRRKYKVTGWLTLTMSRIRGGLNRTVGIQITV